MVPGGAPIVIFLTIAQQTSLQTAAGAVLLTGVFYFVALPLFARCSASSRHIVIGTMLLLVAINLVKIYGGGHHGTAGQPGFGDPAPLGLALATITVTVLFVRSPPARCGQSRCCSAS